MIAYEEEDDSEAERTVIAIKDTGKGIPEFILNKIYAPFFTTRENGTGLGLSIVQQIIQAHNGNITIASTENMGTTVEIRLPLP